MHLLLFFRAVCATQSLRCCTAGLQLQRRHAAGGVPLPPLLQSGELQPACLHSFTGLPHNRSPAMVASSRKPSQELHICCSLSHLAR
jgi:hypothetical protein